VSVEAMACPQCGQPTLLGKQKPGPIVAIIIVALGALVFAGLFLDVCRR
jgi:hypothetical protein